MSKAKIWRIAGINFDHMHMGDLLRCVHDHPQAEIVGIFDEQVQRMQDAIANFDIPAEKVFSDFDACMERSQADIVILCANTAGHADWVEKCAPYGVHVLVEKPFASSLEDADRMITAMDNAQRQLMINWPLRWVPSHITSQRLISEGFIGELLDVHYYDGNTGPLNHTADKKEASGSKADSWFYKKENGGGSLLDYLGYGVTLGTWFLNEKKPLEVTAIVDEPKGLEVDEHSITIARYPQGLSKYETQWGTFSDPWTHQPAPRCGFVLKGSSGTIISNDYAETLSLQTKDRPEGFEMPVDEIDFPLQNPIQYFIHCLEEGRELDGPLCTRVARIGQQITDTAFQSACEKRTLPLKGE